MESLTITHDTVPQGITLLLARFEKLEARFNEQQPTAGTLPPITTDEWLTRQQTADLLKISLPTLNELTKAGTVKGYRIPGTNRLRYKSSDVNNALTLIAA